VEFHKDEIELQVSKIRATEPFQKAEKLGAFLQYIIEKYLKGEEKQIKAYSIAVDVFNRPVNFDPQTNTIVRVYGGKLRRALRQYYEDVGQDDPLVIRMPKGAYEPVIMHRDSRDQMLDHDEFNNIGKSTLKGTTVNPTIAVMMFEFLNNNAEYAYLATGLTEETIISLAHFPHYEVVGPLSRDVIRKEHLDIRSIGQQYHVRFVLDGSVRIHGDQFRLTVRLVDSESGKQLWGKALDFNLEITSNSELEEKVIGPLTASIADSYGVIPRFMTKESFSKPKENTASYEAMLRFYHYLRSFSEDTFMDAYKSLEKALEKDPDNPYTLGMLADMIAISYQFGYTEDIAVLDEAERMVRKAIRLDPNCQPAVFTVSLIHFLKLRRKEFLTEAEKVLNSNRNNAQYLASTFSHVAMAGEWDRAIEQMERVMRLNPHHPGWYYFASIFNFYRLGKYEQAWNIAQRFNTPDLFWDPLMQASILGQLDRKQEAKKAIDDLLKLVPDFQQRAPSLMRRLAFSDDNINMLLEGLHKAGLEVQVEKFQ
jgi:TolB-like protein/Tfp pilus assembly protein PilF